jgi:acetyl esterase/lipase
VPVLLLTIATLSTATSGEDTVRVLRDLAYRPADTSDAYARTRCTLDLYLPAQGKDFPCVVWFHGGGIETGGKSGERKWGPELARQGIAMATVDYRLSPQATYPSYIEDCAAATAWVLQHIAEHGGDPAQVYVSGHSAGGYLAAMVALDRQWLAAAGADADKLAGAIPISGQMITHSTVRKERGIPRSTEVVDHAAPLTHARADAVPMLLITGDHDMAGRSDENRRLHDALVRLGNQRSRFVEYPDRDHGSIKTRMMEADDPARLAFIAFIRGRGIHR